MPIADDLHKLDQLRQSGALSDEEYAQAKARVLNELPASGPTPDPNPPQPYMPYGVPPGAAPARPEDIEAQTRQWATLLHISLLASVVLPGLGLVAPILIWQLKKVDLPGIDQHGKIVANWMISAIIYAVASFLLIFILIGIPMLLALAVVHIVFPIIGAVKANEGEVWRYPLSIEFFS